MRSSITAACSCGQVTFTSTAPPVVQFLCHCADCRAATGTPYTGTAIFNVDASEQSGQVTRQRFTAGSGATTYRDACSACGTVIFDISEQYPELVGVLANCITAPFVFQPAHHIWLQSREALMPSDDGLKQHDRGLFEA